MAVAGKRRVQVQCNENNHNAFASELCLAADLTRHRRREKRPNVADGQRWTRHDRTGYFRQTRKRTYTDGGGGGGPVIERTDTTAKYLFRSVVYLGRYSRDIRRTDGTNTYRFRFGRYA